MSDPLQQIYIPQNVGLFEAIYGKNLISLGGTDAIENMFSDVRLEKIKALDIGFGLGGVAFYLAKKYQMNIAGIEIHDWMVKHAQTHVPADIKHLLTFSTYDALRKIPFTNATFDLVYSKGVLNHVLEKKTLFLEIHRVLKSAGLFVIADWIYPENREKMNNGPLVQETQSSYHKILTQAGFKEIQFRNDTFIFIHYVKDLLNHLSQQKILIKKEFGTTIFAKIWQDHENLITEMNNQQKFAIRITAKK